MSSYVLLNHFDSSSIRANTWIYYNNFIVLFWDHICINFVKSNHKVRSNWIKIMKSDQIESSQIKIIKSNQIESNQIWSHQQQSYNTIFNFAQLNIHITFSIAILCFLFKSRFSNYDWNDINLFFFIRAFIVYLIMISIIWILFKNNFFFFRFFDSFNSLFFFISTRSILLFFFVRDFDLQCAWIEMIDF